VPALAALRTMPGDGHLYAVAGDGRVWTSEWRDDRRLTEWLPLGEPLFPRGADVVVLSNRLQDRARRSPGSAIGTVNHRALVLGVDGRVWTNVTRSADARWDGWSVLGASAFPG
jgi:alpha-tubulin suppressor-like RCC1 family protein